MPQLATKPRIQLTKIDRIAFDPEQGCYHALNWWAKLYFDGEAYPWQSYFYHYPCKDKMVIAGIRTGKTRAAAMGFGHTAMYHPYTKLLNTSTSSEQAKLVYHAVLEMFSYDRMKHWIADVQRSPYPRISLINGSVMDFRSIGYEGELLRGDQWDVINVDEAAYITSDMAIVTLRGRLLGYNNQTKQPLMGIFWQMTTPKGKVGWIFERWKLGDPRYQNHDTAKYLSLRAKTTDNPRLSPEDIKEIMSRYSDREIQQELEGIFLDATDTEFSVEQLNYCYSEHHPEVKDLYRLIERWHEQRRGRKSLREEMGITEDIEYYELEPEAGHQYIASWDLGKKPTKKGRNATVGMVWDITQLPWRLVAYRYAPGTSYMEALAYIEQWQEKYSSRGTRSFTVIDATGKGDVLNELIEAENRIQVEGIIYSNVLKPNLITAGKIAVERGLIRFPFIRRMVDELANYTQIDQGLAQDIMMSFCQAMYKARELTGITTARSTIPIQSVSFRRKPVMYDPQMRRMAQRRRGARTGREY